MEMSVRVASLEYLGLVAARLRRDSVQSRAKLSSMDVVVRDIRAEEEKDPTHANVSAINLTLWINVACGKRERTAVLSFGLDITFRITFRII